MGAPHPWRPRAASPSPLRESPHSRSVPQRVGSSVCLSAVFTHLSADGFLLQGCFRTPSRVAPAGGPPLLWDRMGVTPYWGLGPPAAGERCASGRLATDSGLDAFSQYPSRGSFATPAVRLTAETSAAAGGFLSYYHLLPLSHPLGVGVRPGWGAPWPGQQGQRGTLTLRAELLGCQRTHTPGTSVRPSLAVAGG